VSQVKRKLRETQGEDRGLADWTKITKTVRNRSLATTNRGRLALVPGWTIPGDKVVLAKGADLPLVLRPRGQYWGLVGETYVHGVMHGEAFSSLECEEMWLL
jgi:hypothetical protein